MRTAEHVQQYGYMFLRAHEPTETGEAVARSFGSLLKLGIGDPVHSLIPVEKENSTPNTYSGIYGLQQFPFHTDFAHWRYPPRYLMLRCIVGFKDVPTLLIDGWQLVREVGEILLSRAVVRPRRPVRGAMPLLRLYQSKDADNLIRWDDVFIRPASSMGEIGMAALRESIARCRPFPIRLANAADTLIIDNWRMLHSRSAILAGRETRLLQRAYLERLT
jgi:alpha-ketoglutarate-dependent taurine dioxygenase